MPPKKANYNRGKIYRMYIENDTEKREYVGSTTTTLNRRLGQHKDNYKRFIKGLLGNCSSFTLIAVGDVKIELLLAFPCSSRFELERKERETILERREMYKIANIYLPGWTDEERKERVKACDQAYYQANKEARAKSNKAYKQVNKEAIAKSQKARSSVPTQCDHCDRIVSNNNMSRHKRECAYCINFTQSKA